MYIYEHLVVVKKLSVLYKIQPEVQLDTDILARNQSIFICMIFNLSNYTYFSWSPLLGYYRNSIEYNAAKKYINTIFLYVLC